MGPSGSSERSIAVPAAKSTMSAAQERSMGRVRRPKKRRSEARVISTPGAGRDRPAHLPAGLPDARKLALEGELAEGEA